MTVVYLCVILSLRSPLFMFLRSLFSGRNLRVSAVSATSGAAALYALFHLTDSSRTVSEHTFHFPRLLRISSAPSAVLFTSRNPSSQFRFASNMGGSSSSSAGSIHEFTVKDARGNDVDLSTYKGKVLLIVNVASQCGLTNSNYTELGQLYEKYKDKGFEILAFPCNQFGGQEPGTNEQIVEFACTRFKAEYPIFDKVDVNGKNTDPVYKFLKSSKGSFFGDNIKWNFEKFLVDKDGHVVDRYAPTTSPLSFEKDIKKLLGLP